MNTKRLFAAVAFCVALRAGAQPASAPGGNELFEKHFALAGGRPVAEAILSVFVAGSVEEPDRVREFSLRTKYPGMFLLELREPSGRFVRQGRGDHGVTWQQSSAGIRDLDARAAGQLGWLAMAVSPKSQLFAADRLAESICHSAVSGGRAVYVTGSRHASRRTMMPFRFDAHSGRLVGIGQARLDRYEAAGAWQVPREVRMGAWAVYKIREVRFGEEMPDKLFMKPGGQGSALNALSSRVPGGGRFATSLNPPGKLGIVRRPGPGRFDSTLREFPAFDHESGRHGQVDLRSMDLRKVCVVSNLYELLHADFDSRTQWPERLPAGFSCQTIMETGRDPGLGVRALHAQGIVGKGIGIGIIDSPLLTEHKEYAARLRSYEEIHSPPGASAQMHGGGVTAIAAGETCGVAPGANLYYVAVQNTSPGRDGNQELDYGPVGEAIERLLDLNQNLPASNRIRVISISMGWGEENRGYEKVMAAVERSKREGVFVISTALRRTHGLRFDGLGRESTTDPNLFESYEPGFWWATAFYSGEMRFKPGARLCVPMDARTTASPTGANDYAHYNTGGWSWAVPWIAGLYALACQVRADVTPELFWGEALRTGQTITLQHRDERILFGTIVAPRELISALGEVRTAGGEGRAGLSSARRGDGR